MDTGRESSDRIADCPSANWSTYSVGYISFVSWLKSFNSPIAYGLKYEIGLLFCAKSNSYLLKIHGKVIILLTYFARR